VRNSADNLRKLISEDKEIAKIMKELRSITIPSPDFYCDEHENNHHKALKLLDHLDKILTLQLEYVSKKDKLMEGIY
jgi:hypothetical protein